MAGARTLGESGGGGAGAAAAMDYSVHEAWNEATNVYLLAVLASLALLVYARRHIPGDKSVFTTCQVLSLTCPCSEGPSISLHEALAKNKRKIMRIFTLPPTAEIPAEPNFYDSVKKVRLRQQLEMYSIARKYDHQQQPQKQTDSVQLLVE